MTNTTTQRYTTLQRAFNTGISLYVSKDGTIDWDSLDSALYRECGSEWDSTEDYYNAYYELSRSVVDYAYEDASIHVLNDEAIADPSSVVWDLPSTLAPVADGEYSLRREVYVDGEFEYSIESHVPVRVVDGVYDVCSVMAVVDPLVQGKPVRLTGLDWNDGYFLIRVEDLTKSPKGVILL